MVTSTNYNSMRRSKMRRQRKSATQREKNDPKLLHKELVVEGCRNTSEAADRIIGENDVDRISQLPDDILVSIIYRLTFQEAIATSILSTRWRHLYAYIISLNFSFPFEQKESHNIKEIRKKFSDYINGINHTLDSYKGSRVIKEFRVHMPCLAGANIEKWLEFALSRKIEVIDIRMVEYCFEVTNRVCYTFPLSTLVNKNGREALLCLKCVKELSLSQVCLDDKDIELLLSSFVVVERLSIESPKKWHRLKNVNVVGYRKLKHLSISHYQKIENFQVRDMINLVSLCYQLPSTYALLLDNVPKLVEINASDKSHNTVAGILPRISCVHDQLQQLKLSTFPDYIMDREPTDMLPKLTNLKHMELEVAMNSTCGIHQLFPLIEACPSLEKLEMKFLWSSQAKYIHRDIDESRVGRKCPNYNLRKVRLSGYFGSTSELEFALYVVNNAVALQELMVVEGDTTFRIRQRKLARACQRNSVSFVII